MPKTAAERAKAYRDRKRARAGPKLKAIKIKKSKAMINRDYRARKKALLTGIIDSNLSTADTSSTSDTIHFINSSTESNSEGASISAADNSCVMNASNLNNPVEYSDFNLHIMAREENKSKYSNIEHVRTNMLWMDIKIVDPEMETLMKQINEEQTRLKEALREKLRLMRYDTDVLQKENEQTKGWLRSKGIQFEERKDNRTIEEENEVRVKEEPVDTEVNEIDFHEEKVSALSLEEVSRTVETVSNLPKKMVNANIKISRPDSNEEKKNDILEKNSKKADEGVDNPSVNNLITQEESENTKKTLQDAHINVEPIEDILLNEKKPKRGMKRRRLLKKCKATLKRKKNSKEKMEEVQSNEDAKSDGES